MEEQEKRDKPNIQGLLNSAEKNREKMVSTSHLSIRSLSRWLGATAIPVFIVIILTLFILDIKAVFEPRLLLPILNMLFVSVVSFVVAYISARCYLTMGLVKILLLGCGVLTFGAGNLVAGWLITSLGAPNLNVIVHNTSALFGSIFHVVAAMSPLPGTIVEKVSKRRKFEVILAYLGVLVFIGLLTRASLRGVIPPFFIQGVGPTHLRQCVLGTTMALFAISSFIFLRRYFNLKAEFLYWYSLALALVAVGLFGVFLQKAVGSPIGWAGRFAQYLGGIYFLMAVLGAARSARAKGIRLEKDITILFRDSENLYRTLIETVTDAIVSVDNEGRVLLWNSAANKTFRYSQAEAIGSLIVDLIVPDKGADNLRKEIENLVRTGKSPLIGKTAEIEAKRKDGEVFPAELSVAVRKTAGTRITTIVARDITGRKKAEEALRASEERYALAQRVANIGSWDWDIRTGNLEWSEKIEPMFGFGRGEFGRTYEAFLECVHPQDRQHVIDSVNACIQKGRNYDIEHRIVWPNGTVRWVSETGNVIRNQNNEAIRMLGVVKDITERKQAEEILKRDKETFERLVNERTQELLKAQAELDKAKRLSDLGTLSAIVAHELRNPLGVIRTASYNIRRKRENTLLDKHLDNIEKKISESDQIISNLLSYSRIRIPSYEKIRIHDILNECIALMKRRFYKHNVSIVKKFVPAKQELIEADPLQIREIINNILINAYQSISDKKGKIEIVVRHNEEGSIEVSFKDNGEGIDKEDLERVFEPFFTRKSKGTGLGLTICNELVNLHSGKITIESKKGEGTTVKITLPIKRVTK